MKKPCRECGTMLTVSPSSLPEPTCQRCRKQTITCGWCGVRLTLNRSEAAKRSYCSRSCSSKAYAATSPKRRRAVTIGSTPRLKRAEREAVAPGLTLGQRRRLLAKWKRQGRRCSFCTNRADTVDHVIPLARGGTNFEGNLIPCCRSCNSSKSDLLTTEWRYAKAHAGTVSPSPWLATALVRQPIVKAKPKQKPERVCYICTSVYHSAGEKRRTCGKRACSYEHAKRIARENYRAANGLAPTWDRPTNPQWSKVMA